MWASTSSTLKGGWVSTNVYGLGTEEEGLVRVSVGVWGFIAGLCVCGVRGISTKEGCVA